MPQCVEIIGIFVPGGDRQHARPQYVREGVNDARRIAAIGNVRGEPIDNSKASLGLSQEKHTGIGGDRAAVERGGDFLGRMAGNESESGAGSVMAAGQFLSGEKGRVNSYYSTPYQILKLPPPTKLAPLVNNPG